MVGHGVLSDEVEVSDFSSVVDLKTTQRKVFRSDF